MPSPWVKICRITGQRIRRSLTIYSLLTWGRCRGHLYPDFGAESQIDGNRIRAVHEPDSGDTLKETDQAGTGIPRQQPRWNFDCVDHCQPDEEDHYRYVPCSPEDIDA